VQRLYYLGGVIPLGARKNLMPPTAPDDVPDPLVLLADCINTNDGPAWEAFLRHYRSLIQRGFGARGAGVDAAGFLD
jgi:hypothetical protein